MSTELLNDSLHTNLQDGGAWINQDWFVVDEHLDLLGCLGRSSRRSRCPDGVATTGGGACPHQRPLDRHA